ncbi:MAG: NAD(P)H-dependent oxidoreductase [Acidimicrobiaceae bacterium]|nr:NAD(P)H-dependent oxidoreductase [Acidimicrobiaceae bacterium]
MGGTSSGRRVLCVSGSLRAASANTAILRTAIDVAPQAVDGEQIGCHIYDRLSVLPAYNPDDDHDQLHPEVRRLRDSIHEAAGILFSTPEYAGALPGSLKNLLDWTIGDDRSGSIYGKPVGWVNTSPRGSTSAYRELETVLGYAHANIVQAACVSLPIAATMIGPDGLVADASARQTLAGVLAELLAAPTGNGEEGGAAS